MEKSKNILPFLIGAALGAAVGYLMASGKKDEIIEDLKDLGNKAKNEWDEFVNSTQTGKTSNDAGQ